MAETGGLSRKVIAIAAGEAHTLALTGDGNVYSWGRGTFGRLGNGSERDQLFPVKIEFKLTDKRDRVKIIGISAGAYHSLALADDGSVWSWGYNSYGQLGDDGENSFVPCLVKLPMTDGSVTKNETAPKISSVKAGSMMSLAINDSGSLWMWGNCPVQETSSEGGFSLTPTSTPISIWNFHGHTVVKVACGSEHIVTLVSAGEKREGGDLVCYTWGNNNHGQLGLGDTEARSNPRMVEKFNTGSPWAAYEVACGAFHTCVLAYRKTESVALESVCWTFGRGDNGQLGQGTTKKSLYPEMVEGLPENSLLLSVDCGLFHTSVVSSSGNVWSWGMENGLGLCPEATFTESDGGDILTPRLINEVFGAKFPEPVQVACGAAHTVLLADSGHKLWAWGRGRNGVLGNGQEIDFFAPKDVLWPQPDEKGLGTFANEVSVERDPEETTENEKKLSAVMQEMNLLQSKLSIMERYASILHGSIFGKPFEEDRDIPVSLRNSDVLSEHACWCGR
ncbi:ultraviolet-B receptor UVR8-like isoform X2 [Cynara cardunculus var. scolymus]|uniref:ultraviolet-B receptor UVR8-like isoform X2 n=1 Tax=Cynara cardunculus var. scolymus TaxID=59895 RepID=UPI000D62D477|nr:ultraviolet-B receptor UVR8-like isoform X2 [Cynara cardunculus var. scolymus]